MLSVNVNNNVNIKNNVNINKVFNFNDNETKNIFKEKMLEVLKFLGFEFKNEEEQRNYLKANFDVLIKKGITIGDFIEGMDDVKLNKTGASFYNRMPNINDLYEAGIKLYDSATKDKNMRKEAEDKRLMIDNDSCYSIFKYEMYKLFTAIGINFNNKNADEEIWYRTNFAICCKKEIPINLFKDAVNYLIENEGSYTGYKIPNFNDIYKKMKNYIDSRNPDEDDLFNIWLYEPDYYFKHWKEVPQAWYKRKEDFYNFLCSKFPERKKDFDLSFGYTQEREIDKDIINFYQETIKELQEKGEELDVVKISKKYGEFEKELKRRKEQEEYEEMRKIIEEASNG